RTGPEMYTSLWRRYRCRSPPSGQIIASLQTLASGSRGSRRTPALAARSVRTSSTATCPAAGCHGRLEWRGISSARPLLGLRTIVFHVLDVASGVAVDGLLIRRGERAAELPWMAHEKAARRDRRALQDQRAGGNDASGANFRVVQHHRAHPHQHARLNRAAVQDNAVADSDSVADHNRIIIFHPMQHGAVLNIRARANADPVRVAPDHHAGPDARVLAYGYVADHHSGRVDVGRRGNPWRMPEIAADQFDPPRRLAGLELGKDMSSIPLGAPILLKIRA